MSEIADTPTAEPSGSGRVQAPLKVGNLFLQLMEDGETVRLTRNSKSWQARSAQVILVAESFVTTTPHLPRVSQQIELTDQQGESAGYLILRSVRESDGTLRDELALVDEEGARRIAWSDEYIALKMASLRVRKEIKQRASA